jgi:hypothetical protein
MLKTRSALLIEGSKKADVVRKMNEYVNADDSSWTIWNVAEKYMSGGWFAVLVLKSARNSRGSRRD